MEVIKNEEKSFSEVTEPFRLHVVFGQMLVVIHKCEIFHFWNKHDFLMSKLFLHVSFGRI